MNIASSIDANSNNSNSIRSPPPPAPALKNQDISSVVAILHENSNGSLKR